MSEQEKEQYRKEHKAFYKSWTLWINFITVICIVIEQQLELIKPLVSPETYTLIAILVASVNLYMRLFSHKHLDFKRKNE